jgi:hypothetical protein
VAEDGAEEIEVVDEGTGDGARPMPGVEVAQPASIAASATSPIRRRMPVT